MIKVAVWMFLAIILFWGMLVFATRDTSPSDRELCLQKGGIPIMNFNGSRLKDCKL